MIRKAVVNMALKLEKPILSLTNGDYNDNGLSDLLGGKRGCLRDQSAGLYMLRDTITGWPGGKPNANLPTHPERSEPYPQSVRSSSPRIPMMILFRWAELFSGCMTRVMTFM